MLYYAISFKAPAEKAKMLFELLNNEVLDFKMVQSDHRHHKRRTGGSRNTNAIHRNGKNLPTILTDWIKTLKVGAEFTAHDVRKILKSVGASETSCSPTMTVVCKNKVAQRRGTGKWSRL